MERESGRGSSDLATFAQALTTLKREGSNLLLVGADTADVHHAICHRLLGETSHGSRYRLFVTNGDDRRVAHERDSTTETMRMIDYAALERAALDVPTASDRTPIGRLGIEIIEAIDDLEAVAHGLDPAELRVCVDSLVPLLEEHAAETVFRLLQMTTSRVDRARGMGHYHLPLDRAHEAVVLFEPLFDAIVEVRSRGDSYEQQWDLRDRGLTTDWLPLSRR
ncbi:DUF7504 family protein [Halosolutus gelatinilyticus]|uniref:DUF7504 family protein n=1 Tax=Halosolutus gelatinilyticus TaxID=2931975 RepID=UPI001FF233C5|nr:hypothetical protein [Halosolutus gelatinilyticus]